MVTTPTPQSDRAAFLVHAETDWYQHVLTRMQSEMATAAPGDKAQLDAVTAALKNGAQLKPAEQRDLYKQALGIVGGSQAGDPPSVQYALTASGALTVGQAVSQADQSSTGISVVDQVKANGYEQALMQLVTMPAQVRARGLDTPASNAYLQSLADQAQLALDTGHALNDAPVQSALYGSTLQVIGGHLKADGTAATETFQKLIDAALKLTGHAS